MKGREATSVHVLPGGAGGGEADSEEEKGEDGHEHGQDDEGDLDLGDDWKVEKEWE